MVRHGSPGGRVSPKPPGPAHTHALLRHDDTDYRQLVTLASPYQAVVVYAYDITSLYSLILSLQTRRTP